MKEILDLLAARYSIERQHIESFDRYFATKTNPMSSMQRIVDEFQMDPGSPPGALIFHSSEKDEIRLQFGRESAKDPVTIWNDRPVIVERNGEINSSTPADCRVRDHTYQSPMYLRYRIFINDQFHSESVALIGYHPVITGSSYFTNEQSDRQSDRGFMIIRGVERFFPFAEYGASGFIQTSHPIGNPKSVISRLIVRTSPTQRTGCSVEMNYTGESFLVFRENIQVPLFLVFTAFGLTDREIYEMFALPNQIRNLTILTMLENMRSLIRAEQLDTFEQTSAYLIERIKGLESIYHQTPEVPKNFLDDYLFPHLGTDPVTRPAKLVLLTDMFLRVLEFNEGKLRTIDRDHLGMKRLKMCGETLEEIFVLLYKRFLKDLSSRINRIVRKKLSSRLVTSIKPYFKPDLFTTGIEQILATGVFQTGGADEEYTITELFTANTLFAQRANLQKVFSTLSKTQTHFDAREQHPTAWGRYCATETPEGSNCGLIKRLATGTRVSFQASLDGIWTFQRAYMEKHHTDCISGLKQLQTREYAIVYCQGHPLFLVPNAAQFLTEFEEYRRQTKGIIENTITIAHDQDTNTIELLTDQGRIIRPVFSVENDRIRNLKRVYRRLMTKTLDTEYLLDNRVVRYIDAQQEENEVVADRWIDRPARCSNCKNVFYHRWDRLDLSLVSVPKFRVICHKCSFEEPCRNVLADHHSACEIDPGTILGLSTSLLAFPEFNSAPRSSKGAAMLRQTISTQGEF